MAESKQKRAYNSEIRDAGLRLTQQPPVRPEKQGQPSRKPAADKKYHSVVLRLIDFLESMEA